MTTLYIRDVPEDVAETLKQRAAERGQSLSAFLNGQLSQIANRPTNEALVERLRARNRANAVTTGRILDELHQSRR